MRLKRRTVFEGSAAAKLEQFALPKRSYKQGDNSQKSGLVGGSLSSGPGASEAGLSTKYV